VEQFTHTDGQRPWVTNQGLRVLVVEDRIAVDNAEECLKATLERGKGLGNRYPERFSLVLSQRRLQLIVDGARAQGMEIK
jgi:hypothetical protein